MKNDSDNSQELPSKIAINHQKPSVRSLKSQVHGIKTKWQTKWNTWDKIHKQSRGRVITNIRQNKTPGTHPLVSKNQCHHFGSEQKKLNVADQALLKLAPRPTCPNKAGIFSSGTPLVSLMQASTKTKFKQFRMPKVYMVPEIHQSMRTGVMK